MQAVPLRTVSEVALGTQKSNTDDIEDQIDAILCVQAGRRHSAGIGLQRNSKKVLVSFSR